MGTLLNRLLIVLNNEKEESTYYHIAYTLLSNFEHIKHMNISQIAEICFVSKSTISKFIRSLGFDDFIEFKYSSGYKSNKETNSLNYKDNILNYIESHSYSKYIDVLISDLEIAKTSIDRGSIKKLAQDLVRYDKVAAFGLLYSESAAVDFQTKLAYNGKYIITYMNDVKQDEFIKNADEDTLIVIFSNSGGYIKQYQLTGEKIDKNIFKQTKAKIVVITSNDKMKENPYVDLCVTFRNTSSVQTHAILFQVITDCIALEFRKLKDTSFKKT